MQMLIEAPATTIRDAKARAALLIGAAELESSRIILESRAEAAKAIAAAAKEISESNGQLVESVREELERCRARTTSEACSRALEIRDRAARRMESVASGLVSAFTSYTASRTRPGKHLNTEVVS